MTTINEAQMSDAELESEFGPSVFITATEVPDDDRSTFLPTFFGMKHMLLGERLVFGWMEKLSEDYDGGLWSFYTLSNGAYYMAPKRSDKLNVVGPGNFYEGNMSADAAGIVATLYALNNLAWKTQEERFEDLFYALRDYAGDHAEGPKIFGAID